MDSGLYAAYSGLLARTQALDTAANNLANAGTAGFRAERDYFRSVFAGIGNAPDGTGSWSGSQVGNAVNNFGVLGGNLIDLGQGALASTGNPLDLALTGEGFFAIQSPQGVQYTRNGAFTRSQAGILETANGEPVLDITGQPITVPTGAVVVAADGSLSVTTAEGSAIAGQVGVFGFPPGTALIAQGTTRFVPPDGVQARIATVTVQAGEIEGANIDAVHGTMQLILVQRQAEMMQKALSVFNNDFDKTAAEELGKV
jgi:flagellar basal-body rod protein FlgF